MDNCTTTPLQGQQLLITQLELVAPTTVAGTFYGIAFILFCLYVHSLASRLRDEDRKRQAKFMLGLSTVIMLCGLYNLVATAWVNQDAYIKHGNYIYGPEGYISSIYQTSPVIIAGLACQLTVDVSTSAIQIWRVWVIWSATRYANWVTVLPILCSLTFIGLKLRTIVLDTTLPIDDVVKLDIKTELVETAFQGATTVTSTVLISLFLIFKQWQQRKLIGKTQGSTGYLNIVAMIIESYALETIWLLTAAIIWSRNPAVTVFFVESVLYVEIIAYLLVQYRVASGNAYESQKGQRNISSLCWKHSNHATTQFRETGEIQAGPLMSAVPEASDVSRVSSMA